MKETLKILSIILIQFCFVMKVIAQSEVKDKFSLQGSFIGSKNTKLVLYYKNKFDKIIYDTADVINGHYKFSGIIKHPTFASLYSYNLELATGRKIDINNLLLIFLEATRITANLRQDNFRNTIVNGSKTQNDFDKLNIKKQKVIYELEFVNKEIVELEKKRSTVSDIRGMKYLDSLRRVQDSLFNEIDIIEINFVKDVPNSIIAPFILQNHLSELSLRGLKEIYQTWSRKIKKSRYGLEVHHEIEKKSNSGINKKAPDFKAIDMNKVKFHLLSYKGDKIILIDIWASWCIPCRKSFIETKMMLNNINSKDVIVVAISIDERERDWIKAIEHDKIEEWINILASAEGAKKNAKILKKYISSPIPIQYLIDKSGKIVGQWIGESEKNQNELKEQLMKLLNN